MASDTCPASDTTTVENGQRLLGAQLTTWQEGRAIFGIVGHVGAGDELTVVDGDGGTSSQARAELARPPQAVPNRWTAAGKLALGAAWWARTDLQRTRLDEFILEVWASTPRGQHKPLADDLLELGRVDLLQRVDAPAHALTWLRALKLAAQGRTADAANLALELPAGRYPGKLAIFAAGAADLSPSQRENIRALLDALRGGPESQDLAIATVRALLSQQDPEPNDAGKVLDEPTLRRILELVNGGSNSEVRALACLLGVENELRATDLDQLDQVLLDDLIDADRIDVERAAAMNGPHRAYVLARLDPSRLRDEELRGLPLVAEVTRRHLIASAPDGAALGLPAMEGIDAALLAHLHETSEASVEATVQLLTEQGDARAAELDELRCKGGFPSEELVSDPTVARFLLERRPYLDLQTNRTPSMLGPSQQAFQAKLLLHRGRDALFDWHPEAAVELARRCLELKVPNDDVRAEALTLIAAARSFSGDADAAEKAAAAALRSRRNLHSLVNAALTTTDDASEQALVRWVDLATHDEAPAELRGQALEAALGAWFSAAGDDEEPPQKLVKAARAVAKLDVPLEQLRSTLRFLSNHDADWLKKPTVLRGAPHRKSLEVAIYSARAKGISEQITVMAHNLRAGRDPEWLRQMRDGLVQETINGLSDSEPQGWAVFLGNEMLDAELPMGTFDRFLLRAFVARGVAYIIDPDEGEPDFRYLGWLEDDQHRIGAVQDLDEQQRELIRTLQSGAFGAMAAAYVMRRMREWQHAAELHDQVLDILNSTPSWQLDMQAIRNAVGSIVEFCDGTSGLMYRLLPHLDEDITGPVDDLLDHCNRLAASAASLA
jgi:hypothetical protein